MSDRTQKMQQWLDSLGYQEYKLELASEDASFRRYFRLKKGEESYIVMDAPPQKESCEAFVTVAKKLTDIRLSAPVILHADLDQGFLMMTDFGDRHYLDELKPETANGLYGDAMSAIMQMQTRINAMICLSMMKTCYAKK